MMHQRIDSLTTTRGRPVAERETIIEKDEIISLKIDLETMSLADIFHKYFATDE